MRLLIVFPMSPPACGLGGLHLQVEHGVTFEDKLLELNPYFTGSRGPCSLALQTRIRGEYGGLQGSEGYLIIRESPW